MAETFNPNTIQNRQTTDQPYEGDGQRRLRMITGTTEDGIIFQVKAVVFVYNDENAAIGRSNKVDTEAPPIQGSFKQGSEAEEIQMPPELARQIWKKLQPFSLD